MATVFGALSIVKLIFCNVIYLTFTEHIVAVITRPRNCIWKMLKKWPKNV